MTLDTIIYENIPITYTAAGAITNTDTTINMVADRSLPEGLYLIKFVGGQNLVVNANLLVTTTTPIISLIKNSAIVGYIHPLNISSYYNVGNSRLEGNLVGTATNSFTFILTNSTAKPISINYKAFRTASACGNVAGTFIFQKLRDLNAGEE